MVRLWFACGVLLWMVVGCQSEPFQASEVLESSSRAILGGAVDLRHPAVGRLMRGGGGFCTGTLIASKVILTAAHCVDAAKQAAQQNQKLEFFTEIPASGANPAQTKKYEIDKTLLLNHPQWNSNAALGFDIGVMVLKAAIPATEATPIAWNALEINNLWQWQSPLFLGYGLIRAYPSVQSTNTKQGVALGIVRVQRDRLLYYAAEQGICSGDSGGPALLKIQDQLRVIAVNSYVTSNVSGNQSACNWLGAGMRTDAYAVFLQDVLKLHGDGAALCAKDADCGGCGRCQGSRCQAQDPVQIATVCRPCAQDTDCGSDGRCTLLAGGWRCVQRCSASGCCPQASVCQPQGVGDAAKWLCMPTQIMRGCRVYKRHRVRLAWGLCARKVRICGIFCTSRQTVSALRRCAGLRRPRTPVFGRWGGPLLLAALRGRGPLSARFCVSRYERGKRPSMRPLQRHLSSLLCRKPSLSARLDVQSAARVCSKPRRPNHRGLQQRLGVWVDARLYNHRRRAALLAPVSCAYNSGDVGKLVQAARSL